MNDPNNVSGACTQCFTGFGNYHEPGCPFYGSEPVYILSHCDKQGLTHTTSPEAMLIRGHSRLLEFIDVIEPVQQTK